MTNTRFALILGMILAAAASRIVPHPWNFSPVGAMALFAGATLPDRRLAFLVPLVAMMLSDLALGSHGTLAVVYASFGVYVFLGFWLKSRRTVLNTAAATVAGSVQFFLVTNFAVWLNGAHRTGDSLLLCYEKAIPFFQGTALGDATFSLVLFGGLAIAERWIPALRTPAPATVTADE